MVQPRPNGWYLDGSLALSSHGSYAGRPSSLWAEASGMLSSSLFITIFQTHYHCKFQSDKLGFMADNLKLITRLQDHQQYIIPYPNTALGAEFDLTNQIQLLHKEPNLPFYFQHVKGHQDKNHGIR